MTYLTINGKIDHMKSATPFRQKAHLDQAHRLGPKGRPDHRTYAQMEARKEKWSDGEVVADVSV
jgi:hypothetical protein